MSTAKYFFYLSQRMRVAKSQTEMNLNGVGNSVSAARPQTRDS